jgi:hypothetical protein
MSIAGAAKKCSNQEMQYIFNMEQDMQVLMPMERMPKDPFHTETLILNY